MSALQGALFLLQMDSFSCRNAHAFNRLSSRQVACCEESTGFPPLCVGLRQRSSPLFPSFQGLRLFVVFRRTETSLPVLSPVLPRNGVEESSVLAEAFTQARLPFPARILRSSSFGRTGNMQVFGSRPPNR